VLFYDLESLLKPTSGSNEGSSKSTNSHRVEGSYLIAENTDGTEELGEEDTETWLDETLPVCVQDPERDACFEVEQDINLRAAVVTQVIDDTDSPLLERENVVDLSHPVREVDDLDSTWDW
jgi:hypothetical protein